MSRDRLKKRWRNWVFLIPLFLTIVLGWFSFFGYHAEAASDLYIMCDGEELNPGTPLQMKNKQIQLILGSNSETMYEDKSLYEVRWSIETGKDVATIEEGSSQIYGLVTAKQPGAVTVSATVYNKVGDTVGTTVGSVTCKLEVVFSIDTSVNDNIYKYAHEGDSQKSMFLRTTDSVTALSLNYGEAAEAQWTSANTDVVTVTDTGVVMPTGAGRTQITATYSPADSPETSYTTSMDVYVYPSVSDTNSNFKKIVSFGLESGGIIYTDTNFSNSNEPIKSKIAWVVKKDTDNGGEEIIADSVGKTSDLIDVTTSTSSYSNGLRVNAKAGVYHLYFYPAGAYKGESNYIGTDVFSPTVLTLSVYADFADYERTISVGSDMNLADLFNLTTEEFNTYFYVTMDSNAGAWQTYAEQREGGAVVHAIDTNDDSTTIVNANIEVVPKYKDKVATLVDPTNTSLVDRMNYKVAITIAGNFYLDQTYLTMYADQEITLNAYYKGEQVTASTVEWTTADDKYVTVNEIGKVKALKVTSSDVEIMATYNINGSLEKATCKVKVIQTAANLKISQTKAEMNIGESIVLNVSANPELAVAPYEWLVTDEKCLSYVLTSDNKTATVTANAVPDNGGTVSILATNPANGERVVCNITINAPYESLKLSSDSVEMKMGTTSQLKVTSFTPKNVTQKELNWKSLDTSIVTIDEFGTLTAVAPGVTYIMVTPEYNPNGIYVQVPVTVVSGCLDLSVSSNALTLNANESQVLKVTLNPKGCLTQLTWTVTDPNVAVTAYDTETNQVTITGKKAGEAIIFVTSDDGPAAQINVKVLQPCTNLAFSPQTYEMIAGDTYTPNLVKTPSDTTDEIIYTTYNSQVADVDNNGIITAKKTGDTFIQATSTSGQIAIIQISVKEGLTGVALKQEKVTIEVDESITLTPEFTPTIAYDKTMNWTVTDSGIAKIEPEGTSGVKVTGVQGGVTLVKGISKDGGFVVSCLVTVTEKSSKVTVSPKSKYLPLGKSFTVKAKIETKTATNKSIKWTTSNAKIATVSKKGKVKGKKVGVATITAKAKDGSGASAKCTVHVVRRIAKLTLNRYVGSMLIGETMKLKAKIVPKNATVKALEWSSSNNAVATVDTTGRVQAISEGMVKIRAKTKDGTNKQAVCLITVRTPVEATGVTVTSQELIVAKGRHIPSGIAISPSNSTDKIKYYSDNKRVATVDKRGKIYAKRKGQVTIYGVTSNGQTGYTDVLVVGLNRTTLPMRVYDTETLTVDEIKDNVMWYSQNPMIASVDSSGKVMGRHKGVTRVYAKVRGLKLSCKIIVKGI